MKNPYRHLPEADMCTAIALDIHEVVRHAQGNPKGDYGTHAAPNRGIALLASFPDSTQVLGAIRTVAGWVTFVTGFNAHYAPLPREEMTVRAAALRLVAFIELIRTRERRSTPQNRTGDSAQ